MDFFYHTYDMQMRLCVYDGLNQLSLTTKDTPLC